MRPRCNVPQGYTIPLDKRLAADGRGLQQTVINDKFASLSESLFMAEAKAREAIQMRSNIQRQLHEKEKVRGGMPGVHHRPVPVARGGGQRWCLCLFLCGDPARCCGGYQRTGRMGFLNVMLQLLQDRAGLRDTTAAAGEGGKCGSCVVGQGIVVKWLGVAGAQGGGGRAGCADECRWCCGVLRVWNYPWCCGVLMLWCLEGLEGVEIPMVLRCLDVVVS